MSFSFLILLYVSFFGKKNRTDKDKLPFAVRKEKHNTGTHGLLWSISMRAKVPGGCRLQFDQIARDVQYRMPSSKDDIMRSTWFCCYSNCDNCFNAFREENCCYRSKASPLSFLFVTCRPYPLLKPFGYGQETEQLTFKLKQAGMLENSVDLWGTIIYSLNMD